MKRIPYLYEIVFSDGRTERAIFYASTRAEAEKYATEWGRRHGVEVEPAEDETA